MEYKEILDKKAEMFKMMIDQENQSEIQCAHEDEIEEDLEDILAEIEQDRKFKLSKLDQIKSLSGKGETSIVRFLQITDYIDVSELSNKNKLDACLTAGSLINYECPFGNNHGGYTLLTDDEFLLFILSMISELPEDYSDSLLLMSDKQMLSAVIGRTDDLVERVNICYKVMNVNETKEYADLDQVGMLDEAFNIINNYPIKERNK